jgi:hypothetical protein
MKARKEKKMKPRKDLFTDEVLTTDCVAVKGSRVQFDEIGRVKPAPRISNDAYIKSADLGYLQVQSQKLLGGRFKSTKTETVKSPYYFYMIADKVPSNMVVDMIFKRLFFVIKHDEKTAVMKSVNYCDLASYGALWKQYADANGITYKIFRVDTENDVTMECDIKGNIQHELSDLRNERKTWNSACHTDN